MAITFKDYAGMLGTTIQGRARKINSDMVIDATFDRDIQYQTAYFFDYYHSTEENRLKLEGFDPSVDPNPVPIEIKFEAHTKKTHEKDEVTMHIQFRPGHECAVDYYDKVFGKRYNARYPVGLYSWIQGDDGIYRRWLVVGTADRDENQFPTYEVLRCDDIFRWIKDGKYYEFPGVSRSQNSQIVRFISENLCRKFLNCGKLLRGNMLQQKDEIYLSAKRYKKLLHWTIRS